MIEILIGVVSGIVSGTGMGGGTILIFLLTFLMGVEQHIAQATNLIFFVPTHPPNTKCSEISIRLHFSCRIDKYLHEKLRDFLYPYKKHPVTHLYLSQNQYIDALTTPQPRTTSDSPPIQVRHKSDNPSAY